METSFLSKGIYSARQDYWPTLGDRESCCIEERKKVNATWEAQKDNCCVPTAIIINH